MGLRALINRLWLNPNAVKPFQYRGDFRTPSPASQKPRDFSVEAADKTEFVGSIYYFPRGAAGRTQPTAHLEIDAKTGNLASPKALRLAVQKAEQERIKAEAIAAGKKPPADPPSTANITPLVEYSELEIDLKALPDWRKNTKLHFPPGKRFWNARNDPNIDFDYWKQWSKKSAL